VDGAGLARAWFHQDVEVMVGGAGPVVDHPALLTRIRGAWGRRLMASASPESVSGRACPWSPPCALDVFFREQVRGPLGASPKPYVLHADRYGDDLLVRLRVIGFATEWIIGASEALMAVLSNLQAERVDWHDFGCLPKNRKIAGLGRRIVTGGIEAVVPAPSSCRLEFHTPVDDESGNGIERPQGVLYRLTRRAAAFAAWHDLDLRCDWTTIDRSSRALDLDWRATRPASSERKSRHGERYTRPGLLGDLLMEGDLAETWPFLSIGELCGCGRGATSGMGRYRLDSDV